LNTLPRLFDIQTLYVELMANSAIEDVEKLPYAPADFSWPRTSSVILKLSLT